MEMNVNVGGLDCSNMMLQNGIFDLGLARPYIKTHKASGRIVGVFMNVQGKEIPLQNARATLRKDEWKLYDRVVVETAKLRLVGVGDLNRRGLTLNIPNGLATTVLEYEDITEMNDAQMDMDGAVRGQNERVEYELKFLPLPIVHKDFTINARVLAASRRGGSNIDTAQASGATEKIAEFIEEMLFNGKSGYAFGGGTIRGYTDFPQRVTGSLTGNWDDLTDNSLGTVGEQILVDVLAMQQAAIDVKRFGPFVLYIPTNYETTLEKDFNSASGDGRTIRQRIMAINNIQDILVIDKLTADNVLLVQMTPDVVRMVNGLPISTIQWASGDGMVNQFKIMTIQVPQIRADSLNSCGVIHYT